MQADGNCLYRSLEDQLAQLQAAAGDSAPVPTHQQLREATAAYMRDHRWGEGGRQLSAARAIAA